MKDYSELCSKYQGRAPMDAATHNDYIRDLGLVARHQMRAERKYIRAMKRAMLIEKLAKIVGRWFH